MNTDTFDPPVPPLDDAAETRLPLLAREALSMSNAQWSALSGYLNSFRAGVIAGTEAEANERLHGVWPAPRKRGLCPVETSRNANRDTRR